MSCSYSAQRLKSPFGEEIMIAWSRYLAIPLMTPWIRRRNRRMRCKRALWRNMINCEKLLYIYAFKSYYEWCRETLCCYFCNMWLYILNPRSMWAHEMSKTRMGLSRCLTRTAFFTDPKCFKTRIYSFCTIDLSWHQYLRRYSHDLTH